MTARRTDYCWALKDGGDILGTALPVLYRTRAGARHARKAYRQGTVIRVIVRVQEVRP